MMGAKDEKERKGVDTGGGAYVGGDVHTGGGDFVGRDKIVKATGGVAVGGNLQQAAVQQGATLADLVRLVEAMRQLLPQAGLDADTAKVVEGDFRVIEEQAKQPQPKGAIILSKLKGVMELLTTAVAASEAAQKLLPMARQAAEWAAQLFR